jgi:hypothetical protein
MTHQNMSQLRHEVCRSNDLQTSRTAQRDLLMKKLLLTTTILAIAAASPAIARLQLSISDGTSTFTCFDGQLSCDVSGGANNLLTIDQTVGGAFVQITLAQSTFGSHNSLQLSSSSILNETGAPLTIKLLASDTNFLPPVSFINDSASLTFNDAVGSAQSMLQFWADPLNIQGANPANTPGTLLETVTGTPLTNPDSFSGSNTALFSSSTSFSMTEGASLNLIGGGSITGFNQSMTTGIPEPRTWTMLGLGFGLIAFLARGRSKAHPLARLQSIW